jgi:hypothetical protein
MLWWLGGRREPASPASPPSIDWSTGETGPADGGAGRSVGRAAAILLAILAAGGVGGPSGAAHAAGPEAATVIAPEPATVDASGPEDRAPRAAAPVHAVPRTTTVPAPLPLDTGATATGSRADGSTVATGDPGRRPSDWRLLAVIAATFTGLALATAAVRRRAPAPPPPDVFEVLSTASLGGQHSVRIVRFGPKTLLVAVSATGCQTLAELADPQATACIAAACRGIHPPIRPQSPAGRVTPSGLHADARGSTVAAADRGGEAA